MIRREIKNELIGHLDKKEITLITGPRQVGKTTVLQEIIQELKKQNRNTIFFNLDIDSDARFFTSQDALIKKLVLEIGNSGYVFIDEIQRLENAGLFLKGIYDRNLAYKFIVTGSGSLELKEKIHESLAGRKRMFEMLPVSFNEFVDYKTDYTYTGKLPLFFDIEKEKTHALLTEYLNFGGYPRIVVESAYNEKLKLMDEIFQSYIEKDLVYLLKIDRPDVYKLLIRMLAAQTGKIINYSELAKNVHVAVPTLKNYLWYAEKTFCVNYTSPYFNNALKELTKSPMYYFTDIGLRNYSLGQMGLLQLPEQFGFVFQNFVYHLLKAQTQWQNKTVHYWRTTDKAEIDFVVNTQSTIIPVEVKFGTMDKPTVSRSYRSFLEKYKPAEGWIVTQDYRNEIAISATKVKFIPFYQLAV